MKRNSTKTFVAALVSAASVVFAMSASADTAIEVPAKAAQQVAEAQTNLRTDVTKTVVTKAVIKNPTIAAALVSAIAKETPEMAPVAAVAAAMQDSKQIAVITKAAVAAAPAQAVAIVSAMCKQFPAKADLISGAAVEGAPEAKVNILTAATSAAPSVSSSSSVALPPPTSGGAPFTPVSGTPVEKTRADTGSVTHGVGRDYSGG
jgi:hypothetical protein